MRDGAVEHGSVSEHDARLHFAPVGIEDIAQSAIRRIAPKRCICGNSRDRVIVIQGMFVGASDEMVDEAHNGILSHVFVLYFCSEGRLGPTLLAGKQ
ncbi:hypothetical protein [Novosphingobium sp. 9]|uniref:hypothetical protein n=1 Tax=Novosphingobium sp. 9 TaxID=2025349 RepID=UPI0021B58970|nr:hypothetical protein [Novosphingobium sp. 9]